jgi:hypothetical protein
MVAKVPIRTVYDGANAVGLAEFQTGEFVAYNYGGTGLSTLGTAGQILKVNSGATALEWGNVEAVINIDGMTDGSGITLADADKFPISDSGSEKYILVSQISSYVDGKSGTLTNKTISGSSNTLSNIDNSSLTNSSFTIVDDSSTISTISLGESLKITGSGVSTSVSGDTITISLSSAIDATKIANGTVSNTEFQYLDGVTSSVQTQLDDKAAKSFAIAQAIALG